MLFFASTNRKIIKCEHYDNWHPWEKRHTCYKTIVHPWHKAQILYKQNIDPSGHSCIQELYWIWIYGNGKEHHKPQFQQAWSSAKKTWTQQCSHRENNPASKPCQSHNKFDLTAIQQTFVTIQEKNNNYEKGKLRFIPT